MHVRDTGSGRRGRDAFRYSTRALGSYHMMTREAAGYTASQRDSAASRVAC